MDRRQKQNNFKISHELCGQDKTWNSFFLSSALAGLIASEWKRELIHSCDDNILFAFSFFFCNAIDLQQPNNNLCQQHTLWRLVHNLKVSMGFTGDSSVLTRNSSYQWNTIWSDHPLLVSSYTVKFFVLWRTWHFMPSFLNNSVLMDGYMVPDSCEDTCWARASDTSFASVILYLSSLAATLKMHPHHAN